MGVERLVNNQSIISLIFKIIFIKIYIFTNKYIYATNFNSYLYNSFLSPIKILFAFLFISPRILPDTVK